MPEPPRRALQLPSVPGRVPLVGDDAIAAAALSMPQQPSRQRRAAGPRSWRVHGEASAASIAGGGSGPADGRLDRCGTSGAHDMVDILQEEILKRDEWLAAKDEQMRAKDEQMCEQMRAKDEQIREQMQSKDEQLRAKDAQLRAKDAQLQAKDEQLMALLSGTSLAHNVPRLPDPAERRPLSTRNKPQQHHFNTERQGLPHYGKVKQTDHSVSQMSAAAAPDPLHTSTSATATAAKQAQNTSAVAMNQPESAEHISAAALTTALEHGVDVLESVPDLSRKDKKGVRLLCERLETAAEEIDDELEIRLANQCDATELAALRHAMGTVDSMKVGGTGMECVEAVESMLDILTQCSDPVIGASRAVESAEKNARMRGLKLLQALPRVVLTESVATEVSAITIAVEIGLDSSRDLTEHLAACMSVFALGFRNGNIMIEVLAKFYIEGYAAIMGPVFSGELSGRDAIAVWAAWYCVYPLLAEMAMKSATAALRGAAEKKALAGLSKLGGLDCTRAKYVELLPMLLELMEHQDVVLASSAAHLIITPIVASGAACAPVLVASREFPEAMLALLRRIDGQRQLRRPAAWWKERSEAVHLDSVCLIGVHAALVMTLGVYPTLPPNSSAWEELLSEGIHVCKINKEAELSAQPQMCVKPVIFSLRIVAVAARDPSRHKALLASGVVEALLWATAHDYTFIGSTLAEQSASATVALIGRNEGGLTLSQNTVDVVLNVFHNFWNTTSTHWMVKSAAKAPVKKIASKAQPIVDMVIADANKPFVLEHATAIDDLVHGLLVDHSSPRRTQDGAGKLQEICAHALQNLALSDVGKGPLRSHASVMSSLRAVASVEGGMTEAARQYASGALFELDEVARQKAKDAAVAAKAAAVAASTGANGEAAEHVMLSYNWGHQDTIKRINTALKARGYSVWIDIEQMQGSTVEAMADAVEDAAVVCYGISEAYKESTNCRMEAQYAFQQQKDMVPLMLEEDYRPKGWLGMILGVRLWYGFYGTTLGSEGAFEGKMDELCRELGDRGTRKAAQAAEASSVVVSSHQASSVAAVLLDDDATSRIDFVDGLLERTNRIIAASVNRKDRKQLSRRTDALLDSLDQDELPTWLASVWTEEQAAAMVGASEALVVAENATGMSSGDMASAVVNVLAALETVVASHVDKAQALLASMQSRESGDVVAVLEHGLTMLEKLAASSTRKARKAIDDLCERLEHAIENLDEDGAMEQLASCEVSERTVLAEQLKATSKLDEQAGKGCVPAVTVVLETLARCCDPVLGASRQLMSVDAGARVRGLAVLQGLPRVVLADAAATEAPVASIAVEIGLDSSRDCGERQAACMSVFALGFRNVSATADLLGKFWGEGCTTVLGQVFSNKLSGLEGVALMAAWSSTSALLIEMGTKGETAALRGAAEKAGLTASRGYGRLECTAGRYAELLPMLLELFEHDDIVLASGAASSINGPLIASGAACAPVIVASREYPEAVLALLRRIDGKQELRRPVAWWKERSDGVHLDSVCWNGVGAGFSFYPGMMTTIPPNNAAWEELLAESIHLCKINKEAELSAQPRMTWEPFHNATKIVQVAARETSRHKALLASNVVDALTWTTAHDYPFFGSGLAEYSAGATVALIGRNEGGLTLSQNTVDVVLNAFHNFWDTTSTHWMVKSAAKAPVKKIASKAQPIVDMVIADANKPFVLEHDTAINDLVHGLLIDHSSPRRTQDGAGKLQEICAHALQNLALSDVGKGPLRSHASVMSSLRAVASVEGGMTEAARQYASGALFELDEVARQKAKDAAVAAKAAAVAASTGANGEAAEHVMLSYNWGHQDTIKRINTALKARGYSVWIDIEKMQGSTVEAMADAVEDAAVVCYGISEAYKESTNCRMEAQYAFQQQKDMVPLMVEEDYRPKGWLGMILGVRLWYGFYGTTLGSEGAFGGKMGELCRELGARGRVLGP